MQTSVEAQQLLPNYTLEDISYEILKSAKRCLIDQKTLYLGNICARGDIESVISFINTTEKDELTEILNNGVYEFYFGTVLHVALYWNSGEKGIELFEILLENGAEPYRDYYGNFPWQQKDVTWSSPIDSIIIGDRDVKEFEDTYNYLRKTYYLDEYEDDFEEIVDID